MIVGTVVARPAQKLGVNDVTQLPESAGEVFLRPGDVCEVEIEKIGVLQNKVVAA